MDEFQAAVTILADPQADPALHAEAMALYTQVRQPLFPGGCVRGDGMPVYCAV
jgi:hypothetical protein